MTPPAEVALRRLVRQVERALRVHGRSHGAAMTEDLGRAVAEARRAAGMDGQPSPSSSRSAT